MNLHHPSSLEVTLSDVMTLCIGDAYAPVPTQTVQEVEWARIGVTEDGLSHPFVSVRAAKDEDDEDDWEDDDDDDYEDDDDYDEDD